jgi:hypothetical protein
LSTTKKDVEISTTNLNSTLEISAKISLLSSTSTLASNTE